MKLRLILIVLLLLLSACSTETEKSSANRNGIMATMTMTQYEYDESVNSIMGIPSGAKVYRTKDRKAIGEPVLTASDVSLIDESIDGQEMRVVRVNFSLKNIGGQEVGKMVAFFRPFADNSYVVKTVLDSKFESIYKWGKIPGYSMVNVVTTDLSTGEKVLETANTEIIKDSQGLFSGEEHHFSQGKVVYKSVFVRHFGTGLLVEEKILQGKMLKDFHPYEFVLSGWPSGR